MDDVIPLSMTGHIPPSSVRVVTKGVSGDPDLTTLYGFEELESTDMWDDQDESVLHYLTLVLS